MDAGFCVVAWGAGWEGEKGDPLAIGRRMGEPVFLGVVGNALGLAVVRAGSVGGEAPDIPAARPDVRTTRAIGVDVDPLSVDGIVGAIVGSWIVGEAFFLAAGDWDAVDIEVAGTLSDKSQPLAVRGPAVEIAGHLGRDEARFCAVGISDVYLRGFRAAVLG